MACPRLLVSARVLSQELSSGDCNVSAHPTRAACRITLILGINREPMVHKVPALTDLFELHTRRTDEYVVHRQKVHLDT